MLVTERKTDCQLTKDGQTIEALLHLVEVRYGERVVFWNGVWEMTAADVVKTGALAAADATFAVRLCDGREGSLTVTYRHAAPNYFQMAGVGRPSP